MRRKTIFLARCPFCTWHTTDASEHLAQTELVVHRVRRHPEPEHALLYLEWAAEHVEECQTETDLKAKQMDHQHAGSLLAL